MKAQTEMEQIMNALRPLAKRLIDLKMENNPDIYKEWLAQTYYFVCHSVPLLKLAAQTGADPHYRERCQEHIKEEGGHDLVALSDLKALGIEKADLIEHQWTKDFYQRQYKAIGERGELLLGYILALEGLAILAEPLIEPLKEAYGARAIKFVKIHVEEDQDHLVHAIGQTMQLNCAQEILENFYLVINDYSYFVDSLEEIKNGKLAA